jgi:3-oxoacyl-[acyl-carrier-protein] synthase III
MTQGLWTHAGIRLLGFGHYFPQAMVPNTPEMFAEIGVRSRHVADELETVPAMAVRAIHYSLWAAECAPAEIGLLVLANSTARRDFPELAPRIAFQLGAENALAFDVCGSCAGFVHGVQLAAALLHATPNLRRAVVVSSEVFSQRGRPGSRSALVVGDGAGAVVLGQQDGADAGLIDSVLHTNGGDADVCVLQEEDGMLRSRRRMVDLAQQTQQDAISELLDRNGLKLGDLDWVVPHPGTHVVHTGLRERLPAVADKVVTNFETAGNTASATIPTTLSQNIEIGRFRRGQLFLTPTAGAGWYGGGLLFQL